MLIGQFYEGCWIIVWRSFKNIETEHEWILCTHTICISFHVLTLKVVVMYFEPSLVGLNKLKCMCMSYIIINLWLFAWIEIHEYFDEFINLCESVNAWCIFVSMKQNVKCLKVIIGLPNVGIKNKYSSLDNYMEIYLF